MSCYLNIYKAFHEAYARAAEIANSIYNLSQNQVANDIVPISKKWINYKNTVKFIHMIINITRSTRLLQDENLKKIKDKIKEYCNRGWPEPVRKISRRKGYALQKEAIGTILEDLIPPGDRCIVEYKGKDEIKTDYTDKYIQKDLTDIYK